MNAQSAQMEPGIERRVSYQGSKWRADSVHEVCAFLPNRKLHGHLSLSLSRKKR
jgi:hypothetical protein